MAYHDLDDLKKDISEEELIQLTDDAELGAIDTAVYEAARDAADSLIDGYLKGGGYDVPLAPVPTIIKSISKDITIYSLTKRRLRTSIPDSVENTYKAQIKLLESIQAGKVSIGVDRATSASGTGSGSYKTNKTAADRTFSKDVLDGF
jgi:phage gp36-like protein